MLRYIVERNPETFKGDYSPEKFCAYVKDDSKATATAASNSVITVTTAFFLKAANDAVMAAMLTHELAHITMQHNSVGSDQHPDVAADPRWIAMQHLLKDEQAVNAILAKAEPIGQRLLEANRELVTAAEEMYAALPQDLKDKRRALDEEKDTLAEAITVQEGVASNKFGRLKEPERLIFTKSESGRGRGHCKLEGARGRRSRLRAVPACWICS